MMISIFLIVLFSNRIEGIEYFPSEPNIEYFGKLYIPYVLNLGNISSGTVESYEYFNCSDRLMNITLLGDDHTCQWIISHDSNETSFILVQLGNDSTLLHHEMNFTIHFLMVSTEDIVTIIVEGVCPENYHGVDCLDTTCQGIDSSNSSGCNDQGYCIAYDTCFCTGDFVGIFCNERIGKPFYREKKEVWMPYDCDKYVLDELSPGTDAIFSCSKIAEDYSQFGINARCQIRTSEDDLLKTQHLVIYNAPKSVDSFTFLPVTGGSSVFLEVDQFDLDIFEEARLILILSGAGVWLQVMICCYCCFLYCICCCAGIVGCLCVCLRQQDVRYSKIKKIEDIDLIMRMKKTEKEEGAHLSINKNSFKIKFDDIGIISTIGTGGSDCIVFKTKWKGKTVAFKCFKTKDILKSQNKYNEFEREVEILGSVSHPFILKFFGATLKPPRVGILMEYCKEGDLKRFFKSPDGQDFSLTERLRVLREIAAAMQYLHSKNIIHRDLKSENVLLDRTFSVRVMDFGMARIVRKIQEAKTTRIGTSNYMAPDVVFGSKYDEKCDVYSFSILMWEVLTGDFEPYGHVEDRSHIEIKVANDPNLRPIVRKYPLSENPWLVVLVTESWSHDPTTRPSFEEIHDTFVKEKSIRKKQMEEERMMMMTSPSTPLTPQLRRQNSSIFMKEKGGAPSPIDGKGGKSLSPNSSKRLHHHRSKSVFVAGGQGQGIRRRTAKTVRQLSSINEGKIKELKKNYELLKDRMEEYEKVKRENAALEKEIETMTGNSFNLWEKVQSKMVGKRGSLMWKLDQLNLLNENTRLSVRKHTKKEVLQPLRNVKDKRIEMERRMSIQIEGDSEDDGNNNNNQKKKKGKIRESLREELRKITESHDLISREKKESLYGRKKRVSPTSSKKGGGHFKNIFNERRKRSNLGGRFGRGRAGRLMRKSGSSGVSRFQVMRVAKEEEEEEDDDDESGEGEYEEEGSSVDIDDVTIVVGGEYAEKKNKKEEVGEDDEKLEKKEEEDLEEVKDHDGDDEVEEPSSSSSNSSDEE